MAFGLVELRWIPNPLLSINRTARIGALESLSYQFLLLSNISFLLFPYSQGWIGVQVRLIDY
jgi:hypothetical protein